MLSDEKIYTSIQEEPAENEEDKKDGELFPEEEDEDDKRSYQSEEAMKPEEGHATLNPEQLAKINQ